MVYHTLEFQDAERLSSHGSARTRFRELEFMRLTSDIFIIFILALTCILMAINCHRYTR